MKYAQILLSFLKGATAKFGTTTNLLREIILSVLTAVVVAVSVQLMSPKDHDPVSDFKDVLATIRYNQHQADSATFALKVVVLHRQIDSLQTIIHKHNEQDSLRATDSLSDLDAMRKINRAIRPQ